MITTYSLRRTLFATALLAGLLATSIAFAADDDTASSDPSVRVKAEVRLRTGLELDAMKEQAEALRIRAEAAAEAKRAEVRANIDAHRTEVRSSIDGARTLIRTELGERRLEIKANFDTRREAFNENAEEREQERDERRAEISEKLETRASARLGAHLDRFTTILDAAIERMYGLIRRVTERADLMDAAGRSTLEAREYLDLAVSELVAAEGDLTSIDADIEASLAVEGGLSLDALRELFAGTKEVLQSAKEHVRAAHEAVRNAVAALKAEAEVSAEAVRQDGDGDSE